MGTLFVLIHHVFSCLTGSWPQLITVDQRPLRYVQCDEPLFKPHTRTGLYFSFLAINPFNLRHIESKRRRHMTRNRRSSFISN